MRTSSKNQLALIIGGSKSLGEVTAKILASGSADVKLTYFKGVKDAKKVVNEISNQGLLANALPTMFYLQTNRIY